MYLRGIRVSYRCTTPLILALVLFPAGVVNAHGVDNLLLYVGIPIVIITAILTPFIKWCSLRWLMAETVRSPVSPISIMELCACVAAFYAVGYLNLPDRIHSWYGYETWQVSGTAAMGAWVLVWFLANSLINFLLIRSTNGSTGHMLSWKKRILISVVFGAISPGLFWLFTIVSE